MSSENDTRARRDHDHLAWFLGPKAEHSDLFEGLMLLILRDYVHWRKNYFPSDPILLTKALQRDFVTAHDSLNQHVHELLALLRRNFPFYSPRYIAHELSDTLMPALLGYFAGMMFNPNNVTPEAAPVTTELEVEACSAILQMLGYTPPPPLPPDSDEDDEKYYEKVQAYYQDAAAKQFGWAHISSGGTTANIEALWVARQVRYFPLAVQELCTARKVPLGIKLPSGAKRDIRKVTRQQLLQLKPNECIYLLPRLVGALRQHTNLLADHAGKEGERTWDLLNEMPSGLSKGVGAVFGAHPPAIFVAGTRHYSISKAADVLGIGHDNIVPVDVDTLFRMDLRHLESTIKGAIKEGRVPMAVVANAGTTEEGAMDPIDGIVSLRDRLSKESKASFWLHVDAAWSGYMRSLFRLDASDEVGALTKKIAYGLKLDVKSEAMIDWFAAFDQSVRKRASEALAAESKTDDGDSNREVRNRNFTRTIQSALTKLRHAIDSESHSEVLSLLPRFAAYFAKFGHDFPPTTLFTLTERNLKDIVDNYVRHELEIARGAYRRSLRIQWPSKEVFRSFMAFPRAESITVDPHKMGYSPYPCGCIAFRNDRVRLFILQRAPYITAMRQNPLFHVPPRHMAVDEKERSGRRTIVESFSKYILEGSKPGAAAAGLWLSVKTVPLTMRKHGAIVRASVLAARDLYEWLKQWHELAARSEHGVDYQFVPLAPDPPDTNLVTFVVRKLNSHSLADMNRMSESVYKHFTIQTELGEREYSYSQSFFLSRTVMAPPEYPLRVFTQKNAEEEGAGARSFFGRCDLGKEARKEFLERGIVVLRATVMNPYLTTLHDENLQDMTSVFLHELAAAAAQSVRTIT